MISISLDLFVLIGKFIVSLTQNIGQYIRILSFQKGILPKEPVISKYITCSSNTR